MAGDNECTSKSSATHQQNSANAINERDGKSLSDIPTTGKL